MSPDRGRHRERSEKGKNIVSAIVKAKGEIVVNKNDEADPFTAPSKSAF